MMELSAEEPSSDDNHESSRQDSSELNSKKAEKQEQLPESKLLVDDMNKELLGNMEKHTADDGQTLSAEVLSYPLGGILIKTSKAPGKALQIMKLLTPHPLSGCS